MKTISQREIIRRLNKAIANNTGEPDEAILMYKCKSCLKSVVTQQSNVGTTPMKLTCPQCGGAANHYTPGDEEVIEGPTYEWYRPDAHELFKLRRKDPGLLDHVFSGGLLLRKLKLYEKINAPGPEVKGR